MDTENERFSRQCIEYLLSLGHRRIAYVGGDPEVKVVRERLNGYQAAMRAAGIDYLPAWIDYGYFVEDGGYQAVQRMMSLGDAAPTAYYAANDLMAIGILRALRERDIDVPGEVSVIGTNDAVEASHVYPSLTSLQVPYAQMAAEAAAMLIRLIEGEPVGERQRLVDSVLIVRDSTGPPSRNRAGTNNHHSVHVR